MRLELTEKMVLLILLGVICISLLISASSRGLMWDEAHHANPALFVYNLMKDRPQDIIGYATDYHSHYKFFAVFASYPPMNMAVVSSLYSLLGPSILVSRLFAIFESLLMLYFVFKLSKLYSRGNRYIPFLCVILTALHPVVFLYSASNMLDIGLTLFMVASTYFFVKYLRTEKNPYLYGTAAAIGLGLLTKLSMVLMFVPIILVLLIERKLYLFRKHGREFSKAVLVFFVSVSPLIAQVAVMHFQGLLDIFLGHWARPSSTGILESLLITNSSLIQSSLGVIFYQWFLAPFFIIGIYLLLSRRAEVDKFLLITMALIFWFYTSNIAENIPDPRFVLPIVPFAVITACYTLAAISEWVSSRNLKLAVAAVFIVLAATQSYTYYSLSFYYDVPNLDRAAAFVIEDADGRTTVLTTWGQPQMFEFARLDAERKIYTMYMPNKQFYSEGGYTQTDNIKRAINGDFSYYQSKDLWDRFGIEHPNPDYVIIHEKVLREKSDSYDYGLEYFEGNPDFRLLKVIEGNVPYERIFIYRIMR